MNIKELKIYYFDIEVLKDFMTFAYADLATKKSDYIVLNQSNLEASIKSIKKLFNIENSIWIGWNVAYDKAMLMNLFYLYDNKMNIENSGLNKFKNAYEKAFNTKAFSNHMLLTYMKNFSNKWINEETVYSFLYNETLNSKELKDFTYEEAKNHSWIFYDAMKEATARVGLKTYQANSGIDIKEFAKGFDLYYDKMTNKDFEELKKYNLNDVNSLMLLHSNNLNALYAKIKVCELSNLDLKHIEKKNGSLVNKIFNFKTKSNQHSFKANEIPLNQYEDFYDFMIHKNYSIEEIKNEKMIEFLEMLKREVKNNKNPYYEIIYKVLNTKFKKVKIPLSLEDIKGFSTLGISKEELPLYQYSLDKEFYKPDLNIAFMIKQPEGILEGDIKNGGLHSAIKNKMFRDISLKDLDSQYPSIIIEYDLFSRNLLEEEKKKYTQMKEDRVRYKHLSKDTNLSEKQREEYKMLANALKLILNIFYGVSKAPYYDLWDYDMGNRICYTGELLILYMSYCLEEIGIRTLQHNTDGIMTIKDNAQVKEVMEKYHKDTRMLSTNDKYDLLYQKSVNEYIAYDKVKEQYHIKGAFIKDGMFKGKEEDKEFIELSSPNFTLNYPIIGKMLINKLLFDISFEESIDKNPQLIYYVKTIKTSKQNPMICCVNDKEQLVSIEPYKVFRMINVKEGKKYRWYKNANKYDKISFLGPSCLSLQESILNKYTYDYDLDFAFYLNIAKEKYLVLTNKLDKVELEKIKRNKSGDKKKLELLLEEI